MLADNHLNQKDAGHYFNQSINYAQGISYFSLEVCCG